MGDSLTFGLYCNQREKYVRQTMDALSTQYPFSNQGHNQWTTTDVLNDAATIDALYDGNLTQNILVVWIGINDMRGSTLTPAQAYDNVVSYCQARQNVGWTVVILTLGPASDIYMTDPQRAAYEARRQEFNGYIAANYATFADALADNGSDSTIGDSGDETNTDYYFDKLHITPSGAAIVAGYASTAIESILI